MLYLCKFLYLKVMVFFLPICLKEGILSTSLVGMKHTSEPILYATKESLITKLDTKSNIMR